MSAAIMALFMGDQLIPTDGLWIMEDISLFLGGGDLLQITNWSSIHWNKET